MTFPVERLRRQFPALERADGFLFFDNAAGAQIPDRVLAAVTDHLIGRNVQRGGAYPRSREVDAMIARAREAVAAFVNARAPDEIAFGLNATSFMRAISLAVGQTLESRSEIVVSELDHESNIGTWLALEPSGARISWWRPRRDGELHVADLEPLVTERTRLVACTLASNATGTLVDAAAVCRLAHKAGAEVFLDAVHYAPHGRIDVQAIGCDYLVCSGYKIFAPHMGFAWCRRESINRLPVFREGFIPDVTPDKLEAGTYAYENVAGMEAAIGYLEDLGRTLPGNTGGLSQSDAIAHAMSEIAAYERTLSSALLDAVGAIAGAAIHGVADRRRLAGRVPTLCFTVDGVAPSSISQGLADRGIGIRSGHMYSPRLMSRLGLMPAGAARASLAHYNTVEEVTRFRNTLVEVVHDARRRAPS